MRTKILVGLGLIISYQLLNWWLVKSLSTTVYVNREAFFGLVGEPKLIALVLLVAVIFVIKLVQSGLGAWGQWGLVLLSVGGLSNLIDRLSHGGVIDYVPFGQFSIFNLADVAIVLGALMISFDRPMSGQQKTGEPSPKIVPDITSVGNFLGTLLVMTRTDRDKKVTESPVTKPETRGQLKR